ncbi:MATE family efflux transporter [Flexibacterium corallicola]|uniref:MATE family efflux transporter n=1 Tax=Flexibacterium corallicola TaxID=3037259 RepID=UPI00286F5B5B|nr:MATE family efflux transporter [Pseudovibrio sp. M1P-2-3]
MSSTSQAVKRTSNYNLWTQECRSILTLGLPLVGAQLAQMGISISDTVMVGWLGTEQLAALVLATQLGLVIHLTGYGILGAVLPLASTAEGKGDKAEVRRVTRMGLWWALLLALIATPVLWFTEPIFLAFGQEPEVSRLASEYLRIFLWSYYFSMAVIAFRGFFSSIGKTTVLLWANIVGVLLNILFNYILIFGALGIPAYGIHGAAAASLVTYAGMLSFLLAYVYWEPKARSYDLLTRFWKADFPKMVEIFKLGYPIALMFLSDVGVFIVAAFFMGWIGAVEVAAHGIALQVVSIIYMIPMGISNAGTVRVGQALGRKDKQGITLSGWSIILMAMVITLTGTLLLWLFSDQVLALYIEESNPDIVELSATATTLLLIGTAFLMADGVQVAASAALRGLSDTKVPMYIGLFCYWGISATLAYALGFWVELGAMGIWIGLSTGLFVTATLFSLRFYNREKLGLAG